MLTGVLRLLVLTALAAVLAGCGAHQQLPVPRRVTAIEPGTCWNGTLARPRPCAKPHTLEVYAVVRVPAELVAGASYAELRQGTSSRWRHVRDAVNEACAARTPWGRAERRSGLPLQLTPSLAPGSGLALAWDAFPRARWARGEHRFVCTFQQLRAGTVRFADVATRRLPASARVCFDAPAHLVPCAGPHRAEEIGEMILNLAVDRGRIDAARALAPGSSHVTLSRSEYAHLDAACRALLAEVSGRHVPVRAVPGAVHQWPSASGAYLASCLAMPGAGTRGSLFDR